MNNWLEIEDWTAGYVKGVPIVKDIHVSVGENELVTVVGTNGSGKSTLLRSIMGLVPWCSGTISVHGKLLKNNDIATRIKNGIGYVPQVNNVFYSLTVQENLQVAKGFTQDNCENLLNQFPILKERFKTNAGVLSGGERQQLAFARALMGNPKLLILDEPTAALSPEKVESIFDLIKTMRENGKAILMVEQRARIALRISDRGYILDRGKTVLSGPAKELLANNEMGRLYIGVDN